MYRTVTVTAVLIGSVSVQASLLDSTVLVTPSIGAEVDVTAEVSGSFFTASADVRDAAIEVSADLSTPVVRYNQDVDYYTGPFQFTPTQETQTVSIREMMATQDITINPIPSNYGLITWDGRALTVS